MKHYTIPFFIPHKGCPFECAFCAQKKITGRQKSVVPADVASTIEQYLATMPLDGGVREVGFFGGSFTGLPQEEQAAFLRAVQPFIAGGVITGIRLSTRPDYIDADTLTFLKKNHVTTIELGVQSMDDAVLRRARRGHTAGDVRRSSPMIIEQGFTLGHQLMIGLPGSSFIQEMRSLRECAALGAREMRLYPVIVIKDTALAEWYLNKEYIPLSEHDAITRCVGMVRLCERYKIKLLRCGLHPSPGLLSGEAFLAGPFHPAFGAKVRTVLMQRRFKYFFTDKTDREHVSQITFHPLDAHSVIGHGSANVEYIKKLLGYTPRFVANEEYSRGDLTIAYTNGALLHV